MELKVLRRGWRRHLRHFKRGAAGQDPKVFCLSCSDSRIDPHEIFDLTEPGSIFEVKNVGGLFTDDAKAALVFAMGNLNPEFIVVLHHTGCGGYRALDAAEVEPEIKRHMVEYGGFHAKVLVEGYLSSQGISVQELDAERLSIEEGCRLQVEAIVSYLKVYHHRFYEEVKGGRVKILPLLYDTSSGEVYKVPERLDGSENMHRHTL
jgi:carbonic anhydrase